MSFLIPVRDGEQYLSAALASVLGQSYDDFDVVLVADRSRDKTVEIAQRLADSDRRLRVLSSRGDGISAALETARAEVDCEFVARMDGDDVSLRWRLERQLALLQAAPSLAGCGSQFVSIDERSVSGSISALPTKADDCAAYLEFGSPFCHPTLVIRRQAIDAVGGYRSAFDGAEDIDLWLRLRNAGYKLANSPNVLLKYRKYAERQEPQRIEQAILAAMRARAAALPNHLRLGVEPTQCDIVQMYEHPVLLELLLAQIALYGVRLRTPFGIANDCLLERVLRQPCPWGAKARCFWLMRYLRLLLASVGEARAVQRALIALVASSNDSLDELIRTAAGRRHRDWCVTIRRYVQIASNGVSASP